MRSFFLCKLRRYYIRKWINLGDYWRRNDAQTGQKMEDENRLVYNCKENIFKLMKFIKILVCIILGCNNSTFDNSRI